MFLPQAILVNLMLLAVLRSVHSTCQLPSPKPPGINGCSIPLDLPFFYKRAFTSACDKHDVCYACAWSHSGSRLRCDQLFLSNMRAICSEMSWLSRATCRFFADVYYKAVREFGDREYEIPGMGWCDGSWVAGCV